MKCNLAEKYKSADLQELVMVVETAENYTPECVKIVIAELLSRHADKELLIQLASEITRTKIKEMLDGFSPLNGKLIPPKSHLLEEAEVLEIFREEYAEFISRRDDLSPDVWAYAIGGIF